MKRTLSIVCAVCMSTAVFGQADDGKGVMMNPEGKYDLLSQLWHMEDADPLESINLLSGSLTVDEQEAYDALSIKLLI